MKTLIFALTILMFSPSAFAQDTALENYEPPPLFEEPKLPPPKIKKQPVDVIDAISKEVPEAKQTNLPYEPRFLRSFEGNTPTKTKELPQKMAPLPGQKPDAPQKTEMPIQVEVDSQAKPERLEPTVVETAPTPKTRPDPKAIKKKPIDLIKTKDPLIEENSQNESIVTGPKTMPANKKEDVLTEEIFVNETEINMMERIQTDEEPLLTIPFDEIADFPTDKKSLILLFSPEITNLNDQILEQDLYPLAKYLSQNQESVEIKAYASAIPDKTNSAKRIALDRGLAIRKFFISQQIEPHRINLKSLGDNTTRQPADFVEINLVE